MVEMVTKEDGAIEGVVVKEAEDIVGVNITILITERMII